MTVSPIKYEIEVDPGDLITKTATLFNYSDNPLYITTSTAEFTSD
jgi:Na+-transporting NADH:ubiquinone oxidoreductase subunit NqrA